MTKISIIIPMYNSGRSIVRCLKSISRQTFTDFDVILLDDGSKDDSLRYAKDYIESSEVLKRRTKIIEKDNSGVADTRNHGISIAEGEYLAFIDQDDFIAKDYLEKYAQATAFRGDTDVEAKQVDIVVGGYERVASDGRIMTRVVPAPSDWAGYIVTAPWAHLYRREFIQSKGIEFLKSSIGEDVYFNVVALNSGTRVKVISDKGYKWYYNTESVSNSVQNTFKEDVDALYLLDSIYDTVSSIGVSDTGSVILEYFFLRYVCWYMLFSTRGSKRSDISAAYDRCFKWIRGHYPRYRKHPFIGVRMPKGENLKFHAFVFIFYTLEKLRILKLLLLAFGR